MRRREALRKISIAVPGSLVLPNLISCEPKDENSDGLQAKVIVIGAGAAGMYAAWLLNNEGIEVEVIEAAPTHGGRLRYLEGFSDFPLELGADEILGNDNVWHSLVQSAGVTIKERTMKKYYVLDGQIGLEEDFNTEVDFLIAQGFIQELPNYLGPDVTIQSAINTGGIKQRVHHILNAEIGNAFGTSNTNLGMRGASEKQRLWRGGDGTLVVEGQSLIAIISSAFSNITDKIRYGSPVTSIDYSGEVIELADANGQSYTADKVVVAVPLSVLKDGDITFMPGLPGSKATALNGLGMDAGMKAALAFNGNFWGAETTNIISDGIVPHYYAPGVNRSITNSVLAAYVMGSKAEELGNMEETQIYETMISELDKLYEGNASRLIARDRDGMIQGVVMDWTKEPYIRGAYSYPKIGSSLSTQTLALPVNNKVFFAGEATGVDSDYGTVQGALNSAERVRNEIIEVLAQERAII